MQRQMWPSAVLKVVNEVPRHAGRGLVKAYRYTLSPLVGFHCRHLPTCSEYSDEALARHGLWAGSWMTLARLLRCHPWGTAGLDVVPEHAPARARWFLPWRYGIWRGINAPIDQTANDAGATAAPQSGKGM
jgi:putative membrane protein insertion efficiency factor